MEWMAKRDNNVDRSARRQAAVDFCDDLPRIDCVLQHGITFDSLEKIASKRQCLGIAEDVHAQQWEEINVDVSVNLVSPTTNVKIPTA